MIVSIVFAAGCFWGVEKHFEHYQGVVRAESGYAGGNYANPSYETILANRATSDDKIINYAEAVKVTYDDSKVTADELIKSFWELHDPTQLNRQGNDKGSNYRSGIFYTNTAQKNIAENTKNDYQSLLTQNGYGKIVTEIKPLSVFYSAEAYHQDYLEKNPYGYCPNHSTGVKFKPSDVKKEVTLPIGGKEILVIKSQSYCPYCQKFETEVSSHYNGSIPLRTVTASSLQGFNIKTQLTATPTILFIENSKEVVAHVGFIDKDTFYKRLEDFQLNKNRK